MSLPLRLARFIPGVMPPEKKLSFKEKLLWSGLILLIYFVMGEIKVFGASSAQFQQLQTIQTILGSNIGTLITLGIGPIVTASIILQMLVGAELIPWNLQEQEGKMKFQATQKILAYAFSLFEAIAFVSFGAIQPAGPGFGLFAIVVIQVALGGWLIIIMDEIISKWGFGSGVSLFIAAGVSQSIMTGLLAPVGGSGEGLFFISGETPIGAIPQFLTGVFNPVTIIAVISTIAVFAIALYAQSMRVEIPLTFGKVRGFGRKWPLKFVYTSVMPVIFIGALMANLQLWFGMLAERGIEVKIGDFFIIGNYNLQAAAEPNTLIYYLSVQGQNVINNLAAGNVPSHMIIAIFTYLTIFTIGCIFFSIFWMRTSGQDPESVADQIHNMGMQVPGFRRDKRVITKILRRYIPPLAVLGGAFIGFLAAFANITNAFGGGTGILLTVMIVFNLYEELARHHLEEMHPAVRKFLQGG